MDLRLKLILFQLLVLIPFVAGMGIKKYFDKPRHAARNIISANLVFLEPVIAFWSIWGFVLEAEQAVLPAGGLLMVTMGFFLGMATAPLMRAQGIRRASYIISTSLANHGITMGGFFCYLILGERGIALSFIFLVYFLPFVFLFIFPYARKAGSVEAGGSASLKEFIVDIRNMPLLGFLAALVLRGLGIARPRVEFPVGALIMASVALYYFTLGLTVVIRKPRNIVRELGMLSVIKFIAVPSVTYLLIRICGMNNEIGTVLLIQSFMPAAIYSVIASVLFNLDNELASMLFVFNTGIFITLIAPALILAGGAAG